MKNRVIVKIIIVFTIILLFIQNKSIARYYEVLDIIKVRFTVVEENINTGAEEKYEDREL